MAPSSNQYDVIIIGAGAAGMMCAIEAGKRGRRVYLVDHARKIAEKIRISGGGRCNFTNIHTRPENFLSQNKHFCKSALSGYTPQDFIKLMDKHNIAFHEKKLGQLFCDDSAVQIIDMLLDECEAAGVVLETETEILAVQKIESGYSIETDRGPRDTKSLVIATGGLSIPKIGATGFGYNIARQFDLDIVETRAGLVPLTFETDLLARCKSLTGIAVEADISHKKIVFAEGMLFTHRGLSGPSILQISSYWRGGDALQVNLAPHTDVFTYLKGKKQNVPKQEIHTVLSDVLPKRLAQSVCDDLEIYGRLADLPDKALNAIACSINDWRVVPCGTEGYRTAEVTLGGVDTKHLSSKTMECKTHVGLYFIGEVMDVTGWLGGFNFQWAWASGYAAGQHV